MIKLNSITVKRLFKWLVTILSIPVIYVIVSLILISITINRSSDEGENPKSIYLHTNGKHLDIIMPKENIETYLLLDLKFSDNDTYFSFAWGEENFYLYTRTLENLSFKNAFKILFFKSSTLIRLTRHQKKQDDWVEVRLTAKELKRVNELLFQTFKTDANGRIIIIPEVGYHNNDDFYKAYGSYSCCKTCNSWVNTIFKESGLKACLWTPFDFGLLNKYR